MKAWIIQTNITKTICDEIVQQIEEDSLFGPLRNGRLVGHKHDTKIRKSGTVLFPGTYWAAGMCAHYVNVANRTCYNYDLNDLWSDGQIQYSLYDKNAHYTWHFDEGRTALLESNNRNGLAKERDQLRKLSFSLQLSDPDDYEGGELELAYLTDSFEQEDKLNEDRIVVPKEIGTMVVFPSTALHRVRPVTKGTRRSLVGWAMGPPLR
tara:strand:- start:576 stop:1199 length:624 start_codon:yes stop_codon:yes gene_type:complete